MSLIVNNALALLRSITTACTMDSRIFNSGTVPATPLLDTHPAAVASIPSFQDIDSDESSDQDESTEQAEALFSAADAAFTDDEVETMVDTLRERGLFAFIQRYVVLEKIPIRLLLLPFGVMLGPEVVDPLHQLRVLKIACSRVLRNREKLERYNTMEDAIELIGRSKNILVLTGAGVSTSCGIPDFRSSTGLYARLKSENWDLEDPQEMFDLTFFKENPEVFYSFAKEIYPSNFIPSPCHRFVRLLELNERLLRNYTQNIDGLFESVGVKAMLNCHGSFATASCLICKTQFQGSFIESDVFAQQVPLCPLCTATTVSSSSSAAASASKAAASKKGKKSNDRWNEKDNELDEEEEEEMHSKWQGKPIIKPDIVFFGENLSDEFDRRLLEDREKVDLLIVIGTSLRVSPVSQLVAHIPHSVPQILINRDAISHANFDIVLLGDADMIVNHICSQLGEEWDLKRVPVSTGSADATTSTTATTDPNSMQQNEFSIERILDSWVTLCTGAISGKWVDMVREAFEASEDPAEDRLMIPEGRGESTSRSRSEGVDDIGPDEDEARKRSRLDQ